MEAASFDESNLVLGAPEGMTADQCNPLSVCRAKWGTLPVVISCWKPTADELREIKRTGRIWLAVAGQTMPPVIVAGFKPLCLKGVSRDASS